MSCDLWGSYIWAWQFLMFITQKSMKLLETTETIPLKNFMRWKILFTMNNKHSIRNESQCLVIEWTCTIKFDIVQEWKDFVKVHNLFCQLSLNVERIFFKKIKFCWSNGKTRYPYPCENELDRIKLKRQVKIYTNLTLTS